MKPLIVLLITLFVKVQFPQSSVTVYLVNNNWHTGIVFSPKGADPISLPVLKQFNDCGLVDLGWGDEAFYTSPEFDPELAFKALFYRTPSVIRIECIKSDPEKYFDRQEIVLKLVLSSEQFMRLINYINGCFYISESIKPLIVKESRTGDVKFYKSHLEYWILNTCNTWIANCLINSGFKIKDDIITVEELFNEVKSLGVILKERD